MVAVGAGKDTQDINPVSFAGNVASVGSTVADFAGDSGMTDALGGVGGIFGAINGFMGMADETKSTPDRVVEGMDGTANVLATGGLLAGGEALGVLGAQSAGGALLGGEAMGAWLLGEGTGAAVLGSSATAAGGVLAAGVGGYKVGQGINALAGTDAAAAASLGGQEGQTCNDYWMETATDMLYNDEGETNFARQAAGMATGTVMGTFGTMADAGGALWEMGSGLFGGD